MESGTIVALVMGVCAIVIPMIGVGVGYIVRSERVVSRIDNKLALLGHKMDTLGTQQTSTKSKLDSWVKKSNEIKATVDGHDRRIGDIEAGAADG